MSFLLVLNGAKFEKCPDVISQMVPFVRMLDECDVSAPDDVLSKCDEEFIPQGDASKAEDDLEVNSEESTIASENSDGDSDEHCKIRKKRH